ncbi:MAG: RNA ligase family protein [Pirellulales bacterium]
MARTQLVYPKMPASNAAPLGPCIAFEKCDGTNIHWCWDSSLGWYAFGTRRDRFDLDEGGIADFNRAHLGLEQCVAIFLTTLEQSLSKRLRELNYYNCEQLIVFTEFLGEQSFAGKHLATDTKRLVIIDLQTSNGFLAPESFVRDLDGLPIARVVYRGKLTGKFADDVREGRYAVNEGVVCKGETDGSVWMAKIKTNGAYKIRLKEAFKDNWEEFWE